MYIRLAEPADLSSLLEIFEHARRFMCATGNPTQWIDGYPSEELILGEIEARHCFVCVDEQSGQLEGTFCFIEGEDPTYRVIYDGAWLNDAPYGVIHRLATAGRKKGVAEACLCWCAERCNNLRVDTHRDNRVMQHILEKHGFLRCGIILVRNGTERIAYQRIINR